MNTKKIQHIAMTEEQTPSTPTELNLRELGETLCDAVGNFVQAVELHLNKAETAETTAQISQDEAPPEAKTGLETEQIFEEKPRSYQPPVYLYLEDAFLYYEQGNFLSASLRFERASMQSNKKCIAALTELSTRPLPDLTGLNLTTPSLALALYQQAKTHYALGEYTQAAKLYHLSAFEGQKETQELYEQELNARPWLGNAFSFYKQDAYTEAKTWFRRAAEQPPEAIKEDLMRMEACDYALPKLNAVYHLYEESLEEFKEGKHTQAIELYKETCAEGVNMIDQLRQLEKEFTACVSAEALHIYSSILELKGYYGKADKWQRKALQKEGLMKEDEDEDED